MPRLNFRCQPCSSSMANSEHFELGCYPYRPATSGSANVGCHLGLSDSNVKGKVHDPDVEGKMV